MLVNHVDRQDTHLASAVLQVRLRLGLALALALVLALELELGLGLALALVLALVLVSALGLGLALELGLALALVLALGVGLGVGYWPVLGFHLIRPTKPDHVIYHILLVSHNRVATTARTHRGAYPSTSLTTDSGTPLTTKPQYKSNPKQNPPSISI